MSPARLALLTCSAQWVNVHTFYVGGNVTLLGHGVEHLVGDTARLRGSHSVQADVVQAAVGGVSQGGVDPDGTSGTAEAIGERLHGLPGGGVQTAARGLLLPLGGTGGLAVLPAGLSRPDAGPDLVRVVEAGGALGGAGLAVEAGVVSVALPGDGAGVDSVLSGTVGVT